MLGTLLPVKRLEVCWWRREDPRYDEHGLRYEGGNMASVLGRFRQLFLYLPINVARLRCHLEKFQMSLRTLKINPSSVVN
jgi:hypothetical protein